MKNSVCLTSCARSCCSTWFGTSRIGGKIPETAQPLRSRAPLHPERPDLGARETAVANGSKVSVPAEDVRNLAEGALIRLKDLGNFTASGNSLKYAGNDLAVLKQGARIMQWAGQDSLPADIMRPDGTVTEGVIERAALGHMGRAVQLERFGFAKLDSQRDGRILAFFMHK